MQQSITEHHFVDTNGKPAGGHTFGIGFAIAWQNGPLGRGAERSEPNGAFVEGVIAAALGRLRWYQLTGFACAENASAIAHLQWALEALASRTKRREASGIEGTHTEEARDE